MTNPCCWISYFKLEITVPRGDKSFSLACNFLTNGKQSDSTIILPSRSSLAKQIPYIAIALACPTSTIPYNRIAIEVITSPSPSRITTPALAFSVVKSPSIITLYDPAGGGFHLNSVATIWIGIRVAKSYAFVNSSSIT